ncbi:MAG: archease [Chloroflexi bacterium]|nr:archease [Chloroflexota bacterium]
MQVARSPPHMYELLEHTADIGILAVGRDAAEAFAQAAKGFAAVTLQAPGAVEERETRRVEVTAPDEEALLVAWVNELVFLQDAEGFLAGRALVQEITPTRLKALLYGEPFDPERHRMATQVKAATYHQVKVEHDGGCRLRVILDI